mgnify:FL=1|jgi:hypothetical protein
MLSAFKQWIIGRRYIRDLKQKEAGFNWAIAEYFSGRKSLLEIDSYLNWDAFDRGAYDACQVIRKLALTHEDERFNKMKLKDINK